MENKNEEFYQNVLGVILQFAELLWESDYENYHYEVHSVGMIAEKFGLDFICCGITAEYKEELVKKGKPVIYWHSYTDFRLVKPEDLEITH